MTPARVDLELFRELEEGLWRDETRHDPFWLEGVLAMDFTEYCRFGDVHARDHIINAPSQGVTPSDDVVVEFPFQDFHAESLGPGIVFVTYVNKVTYQGKTEAARRSSIWIEKGEGWKLKFQQATTLPAGDPSTTG